MAYDDPDASGDHFERVALDDTAPRPKSSMPGHGVPLTRARLLGAVAGIALIAIVGVALFHDRLPRLMTSDAQPIGVVTVHMDLSTTTGSPTPAAFPAFTDWRVAYLGKDTLLHIVTMDGKTDLAGPFLPDLAAQGLNLATPAVSSNGRRLAYESSRGVVVLRLGRDTVTVAQSAGLYYDLFWSPDGSHLALGTRAREVDLWQASDSSVVPVPQATPSERVDLVGWADNSHLVVQEVSPDGASLRLLTLDIKTGTLHLITAFPLAQIGSPRFLMTPDGKHILVSSCSFRDEPFIHRLVLIDSVSGSYRALTSTRAQVSSCLDFMAFQQDSGRLVAVEEEPGKPNPTYWIIDVAHDTATRTILLGFPVAWASNNGPVITSTGYQIQGGGGPYTIRAVTPSPTGDAPILSLTTEALTFPALGLVRNA